eukprot:g8915.t1
MIPGYTISVAICEVYNEELRDLLTPNARLPHERKRQIRLDPDNNTPYVPELTLHEDLKSMEDVEKTLQIGEKNRKTGCTNLNEHSSRSHYCIQVFLRGRWEGGFGGRGGDGVDFEGGHQKEICSKMVLIDLAGSERLSKSGATGELQKEARAINKSLSALGDVISARALKQNHVPFRNSTLTYFLQTCLSGDAKTLMLLQVSPADMGETACSLAFGARVNKVDNLKQ